MDPPRGLLSSALLATPRKRLELSAYAVCTNAERRTERIDLRANAAEIAALDYLASEWDTTRSDVIRSMIVGAALAQLDRLDEAIDAIEPSFDDVLPFPGLEVK